MRESEDHLLPASLAGVASIFLGSAYRIWQLRQRNKDILHFIIKLSGENVKNRNKIIGTLFTTNGSAN